MLHLDISKSLLMEEGARDLALTLELEEGSFTALTGKSGSGKTTLLRLIAGLARPDRGRIRWGDTAWFDSSRKINLSPARRRCGLVFQHYALFPHMTVQENIAYAAGKGETPLVKKLLEIMELEKLARAYPVGLSGGQKQRTALARALAARPRLLLLDEPLSALDDSLREKLQLELYGLYRMFELTVLMVSHDVKEISKLASRVIILDQGTVTAEGNPMDLFFDPVPPGEYTYRAEVLKIFPQGEIYKVLVCIGTNVKQLYLKKSEAAGLLPGARVLLTNRPCPRIIRAV